MSEEKQKAGAAESLFSAWMEAATDVCMSSVQAWFHAAEASRETGTTQPGAKSRAALESWRATLKMWEALVSSLGQDGMADAYSRGIGALPEVVLKMARTGWDGYFQWQRDFLERVGRMGEHVEPYQFDNLDQQAFDTWRDIYEKNIKQILNIPQLGLTRGYQERANRVFDEFSELQQAMAQFLYIMYLPFEKAAQVMQVELEDLSKKGKLSDNYKDYYNVWIKILEGHYMTLFKSPEYLQALTRLLNKLQGFSAAKEQFLIDAVGSLPIPTHRDLDELYRDLYVLKKRVRTLEKRQSASESRD
jgi:class III poly(R)-hydroxyalkanoic acid synthase PhaE subunit